ncbi:MAG: hypothetical protein AB1393_14290 [Candidatus Edwardsbacteria bacterium]
MPFRLKDGESPPAQGCSRQTDGGQVGGRAGAVSPVRDLLRGQASQRISNGVSLADKGKL